MAIEITIDLVRQEVSTLLEYMRASKTDDELLNRADEVWHKLSAYYRLMNKVICNAPVCCVEQNEISELLEKALRTVEQEIDRVAGKSSRPDT